MLTHDQLATIRAALLFWEEEMCPHPPEISVPYFDGLIAKQLSGGEIAELRSRLSAVSVRYVLYDDDRLVTAELLDSWEVATQRARGSVLVATLLLPNPMKRAG